MLGHGELAVDIHTAAATVLRAVVGGADADILADDCIARHVEVAELLNPHACTGGNAYAVAADFTAVHIDGAAFDRHACAAVGEIVAADGAAVHGEDGGGAVHIHAAPKPVL